MPPHAEGMRFASEGSSSAEAALGLRGRIS
jgi:hypothetical protein